MWATKNKQKSKNIRWHFGGHKNKRRCLSQKTAPPPQSLAFSRRGHVRICVGIYPSLNSLLVHVTHLTQKTENVSTQNVIFR